MTTIREMRVEDVPRVHEIETSLNQHSWTRGIFLDCLKVGYDAYVIESEISPFILGFAIQSYGVDEAHLLNIGIDSPFQRKGLAQSLLDFLWERAKEKDMTTLYLEVRRSNFAALKLYEKNHFTEVGVRKAYYPLKNGREDAVVLKKSLI